MQDVTRKSHSIVPSMYRAANPTHHKIIKLSEKICKIKEKKLNTPI